jgi:hypothetical protein
LKIGLTVAVATALLVLAQPCVRRDERPVRLRRPRGLTTVDQLSAAAQKRRQNALDSMAKAQQLFPGFDFVNAAFAAQKAWRAAAGYRDLALKLAPGTTELQHGTRVSDPRPARARRRRTRRSCDRCRALRRPAPVVACSEA